MPIMPNRTHFVSDRMLKVPDRPYFVSNRMFFKNPKCQTAAILCRTAYPKCRTTPILWQTACFYISKMPICPYFVSDRMLSRSKVLERSLFVLNRMLFICHFDLHFTLFYDLRVFIRKVNVG
ncbi:hypothetical protein AMTRI_Chr03g43660 [Amborella trichopoda]